MSPVHVEQDCGVAVVGIDGEIDLATLAPLREAVLARCGGARAVVLDLSGATFFGAEGCRLLEELGRSLGENGGSVRAVAPAGSPARRTLDLVPVAVPVDRSLEFARAALARAHGG